MKTFIIFDVWEENRIFPFEINIFCLKLFVDFMELEAFHNLF